MKRKSPTSAVERKFWIGTAVASVLMVIAVLLDAYIRGWLFRR